MAPEVFVLCWGNLIRERHVGTYCFCTVLGKSHAGVSRWLSAQMIVDGAPHVIVIATDDIAVGQEVFVDYGKIYHKSRSDS